MVPKGDKIRVFSFALFIKQRVAHSAPRFFFTHMAACCKIFYIHLAHGAVHAKSLADCKRMGRIFICFGPQTMIDAQG